jgi:hypothetical protein
VKTEAELKLIAEQTVTQLSAHFPDVRCLVITINHELTKGQIPVVIKGNVRNVELSVKLLRLFADQLEQHGLIMLS